MAKKCTKELMGLASMFEDTVNHEISDFSVVKNSKKRCSYDLLWSAILVLILLGFKYDKQSGVWNSYKHNSLHVCVLVLAMSTLRNVMAVPLNSFYAYGTNDGDTLLGSIDDSSAGFNLSQSFIFFGVNYSLMYVNDNGDISFNESWDEYQPQPFPLSVPIIAPFWADFDASCEDWSVSYRQTTSNSIRAKAASDIQRFPFLSSAFYPSLVVIVTWDQARYFSCNSNSDNKTNTFQLVLATDGSRSFALFLYLDDGIQWTTGDASDGTDGLGGTEAQVGYDAGDYINYYTVPGSMTSSIADIETTSNVGIAGMYIFQVDGNYTGELSFLSEPEDMIGVAGSMIAFFCNVSGYPISTIQWYKNGVIVSPLPNESKRQISNNTLASDNLLGYISSLLNITELNMTDTGTYQCKATQSLNVSITSREAQLTVHFKPELQNDVGTTVKKTENEQANFNCSTDGIPAPDIVWRRNGQLVIETANKFSINSTGSDAFRSQDDLLGLEGTMSILTVMNLATTDSGSYSCRADNNAGPGVIMKVPYDLTVISKPPPQPCASYPCMNSGTCSEREGEYLCECTEMFSGKNCEQKVVIEIPPEITKPPVNTVGQLFSKAVLTCVATGNPQPTILWYKDGSRYYNATADFPMLVFPELDLKDRGFYYCEAFSLQGGQRVSVTSEVVILNIEDVVQYEAELTLPRNFSTRVKRQQVNDVNVKQQVDKLIVEINEFLSGSQISSNSTFFFVELRNPESIDYGNLLNMEPIVLPVVFTLVTKQEVGEGLRVEVKEELVTVGQQLSVMIDIVEVERFDGCQANHTIIPSQSGNSELEIVIEWPETNIGDTAYVNCPCGNLSIGTGEELQASRLCGGDFTNGAEWQVAYVAPCDFTDLARNICRIANLDSTEEKVEVLEMITEDSSSLGSVEVAASVTVLITTTEDVGGNLSLTGDFFAVVDNLLDVSPETLQESQGTANTSAKLLDAIQSVTADIPIPENHTGPVILSQESFAVSVQEVNPEEFDTQVFSVSLGDEPFLDSDVELDDSSLDFSSVTSSTASITLPQNLFDSLPVSNSSRITQSVFLTEALYLRRNNSDLELGSVIIATSVVNNTIEGLETPISLTFLKNPLIENGSDPLCTFWNPQLDDGFGNWSSEGCERDESYSESDEFVTCHCDHLTSFSVLLDVSPPTTAVNMTRGVDVFLSAVTYIGCVVSMLCLLLTIITYLSSKKLRVSDHGQLLLNLCFALLGLYLLFILAIHSTAVTALCMLVAALLQYFFLVSFMVMAAEAINLYMKLVVVLGSNISHYVLKTSIICWVVPLFIVLFTFAPHPYAYGNDYFCRAVGIPFYVGMLAPFLLIYVFNWIIFVIITISILRKNCHQLSSKSASQSQKSGMSPRQQFMITVMLSVLFGIGWGIGLLATNELQSTVFRDLFASLFVIVTGFHGLLIFILHCMRSKEARKEWQKWFFKATKTEFSDLTSSTIGHIRHHRKSDTSQPYFQSSSFKTAEKSDLPTSMVSPRSSVTYDTETLKRNVMKQRELDSILDMDTVGEGTYEKALEAELETEFTKVDLAKLGDEQANVSTVKSDSNSTEQATNVYQEDPVAVVVIASDTGIGEPKDMGLDSQDAAEKNAKKAKPESPESAITCSKLTPEEVEPKEVKEIQLDSQDATETKQEKEVQQPTELALDGEEQNPEQAKRDETNKGENKDEILATERSLEAAMPDQGQVTPVLAAGDDGKTSHSQCEQDPETAQPS